MPSHMSTIGFPVQTNQDFNHLARQTIESGETIESPGGAYRVWAPGEGVELWTQHDEGDNLIGLNPHFSGQARMQVGLTRRVNRPRGSALDGAFYGWANPRDLNARLPPGDYPFVFDTPDYRTHDALQLPRVVSVQLVGFVHRLSAFDDEQAMRASDSWMKSVAPESCIPSGTFTPDGKTIDPPKAEVILCGRALQTARLINPFTRQAFWWAWVRTLGGEIDIVADPEVVEGTIVKDGIIGGTLWMSGRIQEERNG